MRNFLIGLLVVVVIILGLTIRQEKLISDNESKATIENIRIKMDKLNAEKKAKGVFIEKTKVVKAMLYVLEIGHGEGKDSYYARKAIWEQLKNQFDEIKLPLGANDLQEVTSILSVDDPSAMDMSWQRQNALQLRMILEDFLDSV